MVIMVEFKEGQHIKLSEDIETKGDVIIVGVKLADNFKINLYSGIIFQIVAVDKQFNTIYAGSVEEKGLLINLPIDLANKVFKIT